MIQQIAPLTASPNAYTPLALTWCEKALEKETAFFPPGVGLEQIYGKFPKYSK